MNEHHRVQPWEMGPPRGCNENFPFRKHRTMEQMLGLNPNKTKMVHLREQGLTYAVIGERFGISGQRVQQIVSKLAGPIPLRVKP